MRRGHPDCVLLRGLTPRRVFSNLLGRETGMTRGRDANFHGLGDLNHNIVGLISHLPHSLPVALGLAMSFVYRDEPRVALTFTGDGASSTGLFHEVLNMAAVYNAPLVVIVENNQYAYSTPLHQQMKVFDIAGRAGIYGMPGVTVDGNDVEAMHAVAREAVERARRGGGPTLIESKTMRMLGHAIHDGAEYVPAELLAEWQARDPIAAVYCPVAGRRRGRPRRVGRNRSPLRGGGRRRHRLRRVEPVAGSGDGVRRRVCALSA